MLICSGCGKTIANVDPFKVRYGRCSSCGPRKRESVDVAKELVERLETLTKAMPIKDEPVEDQIHWIKEEVEDFLQHFSERR